MLTDYMDGPQHSASPDTRLVSELLLLPDGRILVHNLTPAFAALLQELNPGDPQIHPRTIRNEYRPGN